MQFLYSFGIFLYGLLTHLVSPFNKKAKQFVHGRKNVFSSLENQVDLKAKKRIWIHAASVGEFEQSRILIELIKQDYPNYQIILTFFSPSGYELRKNYEHADVICYLPLDTKSNAEKFISIVKPDLAILTKYEFWHFYIKTCADQNIPVLSISSIFREEQNFFKNPNGFYAKILKRINYFFVQNEKSEDLLKQLAIDNITVNGDTRFDRVYQIAANKKLIPAAKNFKQDKLTMVCGSTWPQDMEILIPLINLLGDRMKFIIAPHEIDAAEIDSFISKINFNSEKYSNYKGDEASVLWIDNMGMLSSLYQYGEFAYVGGAFGAGLHNILEPASFGLPVFFGNKKYKKFNEAIELIEQKGAFVIDDFESLKNKFTPLLENEELYQTTQSRIKDYVNANIGASERIFDYCKKHFFNEG